MKQIKIIVFLQQKRNVSIISEYIQKQAKCNTQFIVISLREHMFYNTERFVAIYKVNEQTKSICLKNPDHEIKV